MKDPARIAANLLIPATRDLSELQRMVGVPLLYAYMREIVLEAEDLREASQSNRQNAATTPASHARRRSTQPNGLTDRVFAVIESMPRGFTIPDVVDKMKAEGFKFVAKKPAVAIYGAMKSAKKKGLIKIVRQGTGREPHRYEFIKPTHAAGA